MGEPGAEGLGAVAGGSDPGGGKRGPCPRLQRGPSL